MKTTSAVVISSAAEGGGSNVCEFVPSGTMPVISAQSPITFAAIDVIGATVVTTWNPEAESSEDSSLPHAAATRASVATAASRRRVDGFGDMASHLSCELFASTVVLEVLSDQGFRALSGTDQHC